MPSPAPQEAAAAAAAPAGRHRGVDLTIPESVHDFVRVSLEAYPDPRLGTHARFRRPDGQLIDAYVYPASRALVTCGSACADTAIHTEIADYVGSFPEFLSRGYYRTLTVTNEAALPGSPTGAWIAGRRLQMAGTSGTGATVRSEMYLYVASGYKVKLRATYADDSRAQRTADTLATFATAVVDALARSVRTEN